MLKVYKYQLLTTFPARAPVCLCACVLAFAEAIRDLVYHLLFVWHRKEALM